jgi:hypothetical protein
MTKTKAFAGLSLFVFSIAAYVQGQALAPTKQVDATPAVFPLWGDLAAGPYRVGFRSVFRFDTSRTWASTRDFKGAFSPDLNGRPIQINVSFCWISQSDNGEPRLRPYIRFAGKWNSM